MPAHCPPMGHQIFRADRRHEPTSNSQYSPLLGERFERSHCVSRVRVVVVICMDLTLPPPQKKKKNPFRAMQRTFGTFTFSVQCISQSICSLNRSWDVPLIGANAYTFEIKTLAAGTDKRLWKPLPWFPPTQTTVLPPSSLRSTPSPSPRHLYSDIDGSSRSDSRRGNRLPIPLFDFYHLGVCRPCALGSVALAVSSSAWAERLSPCGKSLGLTS